MRSVVFGISALFFGLLAASSSQARDTRVSAVVATDGVVTCLSHSDWLITTVSGPCSSFTAPTRLEIGQTFVADGKSQTIRIIVATQADDDLTGYGIDIKKGEWTCVAAQSEEDIPSDDNRSRTWLYIRKCQPLVAPAAAVAAGTLETITPAQYFKLPQEVQVFYIGGIIDGMDYISYGYSLADREAFVACVRSETLGELLQETNAYLADHPDISVALAVAKAIGARGCPRN